MSVFRTVKAAFRQFQPKLVLTDFDTSITQRDTLSLVLSLARKNWKDPEVISAFDDHINWYYKGFLQSHPQWQSSMTQFEAYYHHAHHFRQFDISRFFQLNTDVDTHTHMDTHMEMEQHPHPHLHMQHPPVNDSYHHHQLPIPGDTEMEYDVVTRSILNSEEYRAWQVVLALYEDIDAHEWESIRRLNANPAFLKGLRAGDIWLMVRESRKENDSNLSLRDRATRTIRFMQSQGALVYILSQNWSSDLISEALEGAVWRSRIICSDLEMDNHRFTTGKVRPKIVTAKDKLQWTMDLKRRHNDCTTMFIGDSWPDILAGLFCDVCVWVETAENSPLLKLFIDSNIAQYFNSKIVFVDEWSEGGQFNW